MNLSALKTELLGVLTGTANLTATEKQKLRDRCVVLYPNDFARYLAENALTDNATNRGKFFIEKTVGNPPNQIQGCWSEMYLQGSNRENQLATPPPETF